MKAENEKNQSGGYTEQYCSKCHNTIKLDFLYFLLHLNEPVKCDDCKK